MFLPQGEADAGQALDGGRAFRVDSLGADTDRIDSCLCRLVKNGGGDEIPSGLDRLGLGQFVAKLNDGCLPSHHFTGRIFGRGLCLRKWQHNNAQKQCDAGCLDWFDHDCLSQSVKLIEVQG